MKENMTEVVFILDKSGSMSGLEEDTIGGFNSMIEKQKKLEGEALISTVLFNSNFTVVHNRVNIKDVSKMRLQDYQVGGTTALLDAVGRSVRKIRRVYADTLLENRPGKVMFVITTDGMENASREFNYVSLKKLIEKSKKEYDWEFLFLGANIDAVSEAKKFGITEDRAVKYHSDEQGTQKNFSVLEKAITSYRTSNSIKKDWKKDIENDHENRKL